MCERQPQLDFYFMENHYSELYLFTKPRAEHFLTTAGTDDSLLRREQGAGFISALRDYEKCKSYVLDFLDLPMSRAEPDRQIRTHSCFSFCKNGDDPRFKGDDRPECISLEPALRDQLVCIYP